MAKVDKARHAEDEQAASGGLLEKTARVIGSAVGSAVAKTGLAHAQTTDGPHIVNGKFQKRHKHRLPRKLKKHQKKTPREQQSA